MISHPSAAAAAPIPGPPSAFASQPGSPTPPMQNAADINAAATVETRLATLRPGNTNPVNTGQKTLLGQ